MTYRTVLLTAITASMALTPAAFAAEGEPLFLNTTHWTMFVLVLFLVLIWRLGAFKAIAGIIDRHGDEVRRELDQARSLRDEAATMLKEAERKQQEASELASSILSQAEADAKALMERAEKDLADMVVRREAQAASRIARAEEEATQEVRRVAADAATRAAGELVKALADKTNGEDAFRKAITETRAAL